jgi:hypothetical protein
VIDGVLIVVVLVGMSAAAILAARSPHFWKRVGQDAVTAMLPKILRPFRPKNLTNKELERVARDEDLFSDQK